MSGPWRILHYTGVYAPAWKFGGPPRSTSTLCEALAARGHAVTVYTTNAGLEGNAEIPTDRVVERNGVSVRYFPARYGLMGLQSRELEQAVTENVGRFDALHVTGVWQPTSRAACLAAQRALVPYASSPRGALGRYSFTQRAWKKWPYFWLWERPYLNRAAVLHYTSPMERDECRRLKLRPAEAVVPNAIDLRQWRRDDAAGQRWRQACGFVSSDFVMLYAGRLHHKKGLELLVDACTALSETSPWRLALIGVDEDGTGARLTEAFAARGLSGRLAVRPQTDVAGVRAAFSGADLFVFPSRHENFGNVAIEALACGCPLLLSDQVGAAGLIAGFPGVVVAPRVPAIWTEHLQARMLTAPEQRIAVRPAAADGFTPDSVARSMEALYSRIARQGGKVDVAP